MGSAAKGQSFRTRFANQRFEEGFGMVEGFVAYHETWSHSGRGTGTPRVNLQ